MTIQQLGEIRLRLGMPEVFSVGISLSAFDDLKAKLPAMPAADREGICALPVRGSAFIPDGTIIGFDHSGKPVRIWKMDD